MKASKKMSRKQQPEQPKAQADKFKDAARSLGCNEDANALDTVFSGLSVKAPTPTKAPTAKKD